ncbi:MAG TPA: hypothetical protein ACFCUD_10745 [Cyclobacteriaceae bacterium]
MSQDIEHLNIHRLDITEKGMIVLGTWAASNILINPVLARNASGSEKYFYNMNTYWNAVNLAIAGVGYYNSISADPGAFSAQQTIIEQQKIEKLLMLNTGLDVAYVLGGLYLRERSKNVSKNGDRLKGFGESLILQGAWLFTFDLIFYFVHHKSGSKLLNAIEGLAFTPNGFNITFGL